MAFTYQVNTSIEINAPPEAVRRTLLDFPSIPQWASTHIKSIEVIDTAGAHGHAADTATTAAVDGPPVGSKLQVEIPGMTFKPVVVTNTKDEFAWLGSFAIPKVVFDGRHSFVCKAIGNNKTEFIQSEQFQGVLCTLLKYGSWGAQTTKGFKAFNEEIKKRCEEGTA